MNNTDLYELAAKKKITIERLKLPNNKSLSARIGNRDFIGIDESAIENSAEERTHLAHEIGHCETGAFYEIYSPLDLREKHEHKATKWAVLHCVPKSEFVQLLKKGYAIDEIAEYFCVTEDMIKTAYTYYFEYGIAV